MPDLYVNGQNRSANVAPETPLLWVLREQLGLTGTKYGCGIAQCGACTVLIDDQAVRSCVHPLSAVGKGKVETIESLEKNGKLSKVQQAWLTHDVPQCGYCQSGMIMATTSLLRLIAQPSDDDIDTHIGNICRCGSFQEVRKAVHAAAKA